MSDDVQPDSSEAYAKRICDEYPFQVQAYKDGNVEMMEFFVEKAMRISKESCDCDAVKAALEAEITSRISFR